MAKLKICGLKRVEDIDYVYKTRRPMVAPTVYFKI